MFSELDKKIIFVLVICLLCVLAGGIMALKIFIRPVAPPDNQIGGAGIEKRLPGEVPEISSGGKGTFMVCRDLCGDGVCAKGDTCANSDSKNCVCPENPQDCPEDCQ